MKQNGLVWPGSHLKGGPGGPRGGLGSGLLVSPRFSGRASSIPLVSPFLVSLVLDSPRPVSSILRGSLLDSPRFSSAPSPPPKSSQTGLGPSRAPEPATEPILGKIEAKRKKTLKTRKSRKLLESLGNGPHFHAGGLLCWLLKLKLKLLCSSALFIEALRFQKTFAEAVRPVSTSGLS